MQRITIDITILAPVEKVWDYFNEPKHIEKWNFPDETWHTTKAESDFKVGGRFNYHMEAKDKSYGFDFSGVFDEIIEYELVKYTLDDGRKVEVRFNKIDENTTEIFQTFDPETQNSREMQRDGWYAILNNFHKYVENH